MWDDDVQQCGSKIVNYILLISSIAFLLAAIFDRELPQKEFEFLIAGAIISMLIFLFKICLSKK